MRRQARWPWLRIALASAAVIVICLLLILGITPLWATSRPFTGTLTLGNAPGPLWVDGRRGRVLVVNKDDGTVSTIDAAHGTVLRTVAVGTAPVSIAGDAALGRAFVVDSNTTPLGNSRGPGSVSVLDSRDGSVVATVPVGQRPGPIAVDARPRRVFVLNLDDDTMSVLAARSGRLLGTVPTGPAPRAVAVDSANGRVFIADAGDNTVRMVDGTSGRLLRTIHLALSGPSELLIDARQGRVIVGSNGSNGAGPLSILDVRTGAVLVPRLGTAEVPLAIDPQRATLLMLDLATNTLRLRDDRTGRLRRALPWPRLAAPTLDLEQSVAVDARHARVYIATWRGPVLVVDEAQGRFVSPIQAGLQESAVALDTQSGQVFVTNRHGMTRPRAGRWDWLPGVVRSRLPWIAATPTPALDTFGRGTVTEETVADK